MKFDFGRQFYVPQFASKGFIEVVFEDGVTVDDFCGLYIYNGLFPVNYLPCMVADTNSVSV